MMSSGPARSMPVKGSSARLPSAQRAQIAITICGVATNRRQSPERGMPIALPASAVGLTMRSSPPNDVEWSRMVSGR